MRDPGLGEEGLDDRGAAPVLRDREDGELVAEFCLQPVERRHLLDARHAPGRPEIDEDEPALEIGEMLFLAGAGRESEGGRWQLAVERDKLAQG